METNKLNQAIQHIKSGNKQSALPLLKEIVQSDPRNESAWLWLYACLDSHEQKKYCLQKAIEINPNNQNAKKALEKLLAQQSDPIFQHLQNKEQPIGMRQSSAVKKQPLTSKRSKKVISRKFVIASISGLFLLFCIGFGFIGGNWLINNYSSLSQNDPDSTEETPSSFSQDLQDSQNFVPNDNSTADPSEFVQPENSQQNYTQPSATPMPSPDVRFSAYYSERIDGVAEEKINENYETYIEYDTSQGLDTFIVYLKVENYSDKIIIADLDFPTVVTNEGYEYYSECSTSKESTTLLPQTRTISLRVECKIPELTTGHKFVFKYKLTSPKESTFLFNLNSEFSSILDTGQIPDSLRESFNNQGVLLTSSATIEVRQPSNNWAIVDPEGVYRVYTIRNEQQALNVYKSYETEYQYVWEDLSFEFPFTSTQANTVNPFIKSYNLGEYQNSQIILHHFGETFSIGDVDVSFESTENDTGLKIKLQNKFIGGETEIALNGMIYFPDDEQQYGCVYSSSRLAPAGSSEQTILVGDIFGQLGGFSQQYTHFACGGGEVHSLDFSPDLYRAPSVENPEMPEIYVPSMTFPVGSCFLWTSAYVENSEHKFSSDNYIMICRK